MQPLKLSLSLHRSSELEIIGCLGHEEKSHYPYRTAGVIKHLNSAIQCSVMTASTAFSSLNSLNSLVRSHIPQLPWRRLTQSFFFSSSSFLLCCSVLRCTAIQTLAFHLTEYKVTEWAADLNLALDECIFWCGKKRKEKTPKHHIPCIQSIRIIFLTILLIWMNICLLSGHQSFCDRNWKLNLKRSEELRKQFIQVYSWRPSTT